MPMSLFWFVHRKELSQAFRSCLVVYERAMDEKSLVGTTVKFVGEGRANAGTESEKFVHGP